jgi:hypothetical protein
MGMTLDKAIDTLEDLHFEQDNWEYGELTEDCLLNREALRLAINIIRKYQKIEKVVKNWNDMNSFDSMVQIGEVLEDGNNDG